MYTHQRMRVNYTSYDMRREQDTISPRNHADIMMLAPASHPHPYLYARVLSIFHVNAYLAGRTPEEPEKIHILWVRWYNVDDARPWAMDLCELPRIKFAPLDDDPFGFISPDQVLRAAHVLPSFAHGRSDLALPGHTVARHAKDEDEDYNYYYIGM